MTETSLVERPGAVSGGASTLSVDVQPEVMLARATAIAGPLQKFIKDQGFVRNYGGKEYVEAEGWSTMGSLLGVYPREVEVTRLENGTYRATVELVDRKTGQVTGRNSHICGVDEKNWKNRDEYARRSMAVTRATSKAYRINYGWVMKAAGFEPTPAEEMPPSEPVKASPDSSIYTGTMAQKQALKPVFVHLGITDTGVMHEYSDRAIQEGIAVADLTDKIKEWAGL